MSDFSTLAPLAQGNPGTAPRMFVASTPDSVAEITATGYLNDLGTKVKENDIFWINSDDLSTQPPGEDATLGMYTAVLVGDDMNLVASTFSGGLGTAAAKAASDNSKASLASVNGATVIDNFASFNDTAGTVEDSGFNVDNILRLASVAISAAEFNGMYAAPKLLIAAPGANKLIVVDRMELVMTFVSAAYADGGIVAAQYDSTVHGAGVLATNSEAAADFFAAASTTFAFNGNAGNTVGIMPFTTSVNKGLYLSNATGAFTTGDSTFVAKIHYRIIATA